MTTIYERHFTSDDGRPVRAVLAWEYDEPLRSALETFCNYVTGARIANELTWNDVAMILEDMRQTVQGELQK